MSKTAFFLPKNTFNGVLSFFQKTIPPLSILCFFNFFLSAQTLPIYKTYNISNTVSSIAEFNEGANFLINSCVGDKATFIWTDAQGTLLDTSSDYSGSCLVYKIDANTGIVADNIGSFPSRDIRFRKIRRDGVVLLEKIYPLSLDNIGQFAMPTGEGGFLIGGATQIANDTFYKIQLIKTDIDGNIEWQKVINQNLEYSRTRSCTGVNIDKNINISIMGQLNDDGYYIIYKIDDNGSSCSQGTNNTQYVIRLDKNGNYLWEKGVIRSGNYKYRVKPAENGNLFLVEEIEKLIAPSCLEESFKLFKINALGDTLWSYQRLGSTCNVQNYVQYAGDFILTRTGEVVISYINGNVKGYAFSRLKNSNGALIDTFAVLKDQNPQRPMRLVETKNGEFVLVASRGVGTNSLLFYRDRFPAINTSVDSTCLNRYSLEGYISTNVCIRNGITSGAYGFGSLQQYTQNIAEGFMLRVGNATNIANLFARNGTNTKPTSARFSSCTGNWLYFTAEGGSIRNDARSTNVEYPSVFLRLKTFGNAANPDSIYIEIDSNAVELPYALVSVSKDKNCNTCFAADQTAPIFNNCPTNIVTYPLNGPTTPLFTNTILSNLNITTSDNCPISDVFPLKYNYPHYIAADWRKVYDLKIVRYDSVGNKATCAFKVRMSNPPCSLFTEVKPVISNCPQNINLRASAGQTCVPVTWNSLTATSGAPIPLSLTSTFNSGHCFPIGTTQVVYTAADSCGNSTTCTFIVTVLDSNVPLPELSLANLKAPTSGIAGQRIDFTYDVKNTGQAVANDLYTIGHYLSKDTLLSADDWLSGSLPTGFTPLGTLPDVKASISIPSNISTGLYYLICKIDTSNTIVEFNENNNTIFKTINITGITSTQEVQLIDNIRLMPNPTSDNIYLEFQSVKEGQYDFNVFNMLGQCIRVEKQHIKIGSNSLVFDCSQLPQGFYTIYSNLLTRQNKGLRFVKL